MPGDAVESPRVVVSDTEAQTIWKRAADLQEATSSNRARASARDAHGRRKLRRRAIRLADVRESAREAGIATNAIERALAEHGLAQADRLRSRRHDRGSLGEKEPLFAGDAQLLEFEVVVDGEIPERRLCAAGQRDPSSVSGDAGSWPRSAARSPGLKHRRAAAQCHVVARAARRRFEFTENLAGLTARCFGPTMGAGGGGWGRHGIRGIMAHASSAGRARRPGSGRSRRRTASRAPFSSRRPATAAKSSARWSTRSRTKSASRSRAGSRSPTGAS